MMGYDAEKMVVSVWAGKTVLALVLAYAGFYGVEYLSFLFESMGWTGVLVSLLFLVVIIVALLRIDWEKMLEKI